MELVRYWGALLACSVLALALFYFVTVFTAYARIRGLLPG